MNETELSQLSMLAHALIRSPAQFVRLSEKLTRDASSSVKRVVADVLKEVGTEPNEAQLRSLAEKYLRGTDPVRKQTGRALAWAMETSRMER